jgi:opacity protein-like surface antigen
MFRIFIMLFCIVFSACVFALPESGVPSGNQFFVGLSAGPTWISGNKTQTLTLQPDVQKTYTADSSTPYFSTAEIFIGWQKPWIHSFIGQPLISQLGISIATAGNAKLSGDIWEDADPDFNNFNYNYKIQHTQVALKGRLISNSNFIVQPYVSGSIGVGFNHAYDFKIQPQSSAEIAAPPFNSNTSTTFTYTLGIGLQKSLTTNLQIAVGYEFGDWGKIQLSRAAGQTLNQGLTLSHLYSHQVQLSLFYIV